MFEKVTKLPLNEGQSLASQGFFEFLLGTEKELCISGPGGVGKTFLMGHLIDEIMPMYMETCQMMGVPVEYFDVHMTATTNKAAEVLGLQTGRPASTVHAFFGLKVMEDYSTGESKVSKSNSWRVHNNIILFIDEASMIDSKLYELIQEGTMKCKIIYVGDKNQLAPVKESLSPVYRRNLPMHELLEPMRTSIPELQALNAQARATVESGETTGICLFQPIKIVPGIIDWLDGPQFEAEIAATFQQQTNDACILAYTNKRVIEYNTHIREMRGLPTEFQVGEYLTNNSAIRFGKAMLSVEDEVMIYALEDEINYEQIGPGATLAIRRAVLETGFGEFIHGAKLPVDRKHYGELVKYYQRLKDWHAYYRLKNNFPDLRQRDARTVYKAQGSTTETVYIDVGDLSTCHNPAQAARLLYVGVSRARQRVAFYGDLAAKYGGFIQ